MAGQNSFEQFAIKILASKKGCGNISLKDITLKQCDKNK